MHLRKAKNQPPPTTKKKRKVIKQVPKAYTDAVIEKHHQEQAHKEASAKTIFGSIKYALLPHELKPRYRQVRDLFYQKCDLKFILNDIPPEDTKQALQIQLQIEDIDTEQALIWKELDHWQTHKTMLPTKADEFKDLTPAALLQQKANIKSNITKQSKRIDEWWETLYNTTDSGDIRKLEQKINKGEKAIHQHQLNINRIEELLL